MQQKVQYLNENVKVLIRKLPANLTEHDFLESIREFENPGSIVYKYYVAGRQKEKEYKSSQAYIVFDSFGNGQKFIKFYKKQNVVFVDELGIKTEPRIDFSQNQEFYIQKSRENRLENSYQQSEIYRQFVENTFKARQYFYQEIDINKQTPLLESLQEQYRKKRQKEQQQGVGKIDRKGNSNISEQVDKGRKNKDKQQVNQKKKNKKNNNPEFEYVAKI